LSEDKKAQLKEAIRQLNLGVPPDQVKEKFRDVFEKTGPLEIAKIEEELVKEGMKREEMQKLCDAHLATLKEQIEQHPGLKTNQPISILMEEHRIMIKMAMDLMACANKLLKVTDISYAEEDIHQVEHLMGDFTDSEKHYLREENVLFPMLEKHGITEPPSIMWIEHNQIRELKKRLQALIKGFNSADFAASKEEFWDTAKELDNSLSTHFNKENNILFPVALSIITEQEWVDIREEFDLIGYCCFTPIELAATPNQKISQTQADSPAGTLPFDFGSLNQPQLNSLLNTVPLEITFVDENDTVQYFNKPAKMIFVRTKAVIGRKVQNCHPAKSLATVIRIVQSFKSGKKNSAEFWINLSGCVIFIRFFAVRNDDGKYLGTVEVVQDVTEIQKLQGEQRLLDWTD
jgi:PAS domain S-box-containing protein